MPAYTELADRGAMYRYRDESPGSLVIAKKRQDSATDDFTENPPSHRRHTENGLMTSRQVFANGDVVSVIQEAVMQTRRKIISDFDHIDAPMLDGMTIERFSDYIARERLSSMPHRGSLWDRVLRWAEFYALQIAAYADIIGAFVPESHRAAKQIYTLLRSLLELGETNASALDTTFRVFYKIGLSLAFLTTHEGKLALDSYVREDVGRAFHDIHTLVFDVASHYQRSVRGLSNGSVTLDFISLFRDQLNTFYGRKSLIIHHIWRHCLGDGGSKNFQRVRNWLNQQVLLLKSTSPDHHTRYDEYTCEWFQRHLLDFTRSDKRVLAITADSGSGKTILSSWIQERLQRPMDRKIHSTVMFTFEADFPSQTTSLALAKSLALQLLDMHLGNTRMFDAILHASRCGKSADVEGALWTAIDAAYANATEPSVIIIDGLEQLRGNIANVCAKITELATKHSNLKSVILSRPNAALPTTHREWKTLAIQPDQVREDVMHVARRALRACQQFLNQQNLEREATLERLVKAAKGSFLWLLFGVDSLKFSKSAKDFQKILENLPQSLDGMMKVRTKTIDFSNVDLKLLFSYLLIAERPLTVRELHSILQVDLQHSPSTQRYTDLADKISKTAGLLVVNEAGAVTFRHNAVRCYFRDVLTNEERVLCGKDAHTEMTLRLLAYSKNCLAKPSDVCLDLPPHADVERVYTECNLLEYAVRFWTSHLRKSSLFRPTGAFDFPSTFKDALPASPYMVLLEWACWSEQATMVELLDMHDLALRIRSEVFQQNHPSTLQSIVACGFVHRRYSSSTSSAQHFFQASRIGQVVLQKFSKTTISCTEQFLIVSDVAQFTVRSEIVTQREEMLRYLILAYKHTLGETSDVVIRYYKALAELYVCIQEEEHAAECWNELRLIIIEKHGEGSEAEIEVSGRLKVVLKPNTDVEIEQYNDDIFAIDEEHTIIWDTARIAAFLKLAAGFEHREEYHEAEEIYVTLWTRLLNFCKRHKSQEIDVRIFTLRIAIEYSQFLQRRHRDEEAKSILLVIWTEHQHFGCESEAFYLQLRIVGELMRTLGLLTVSVSIFEKVVQWFTAVGKYGHPEVRHCEKFMMDIVGEITEKQPFHKSDSSAEIETVMRRMFSSTTVVTKEYLQITRTAVQYYVRKQQWAEAIELLTKCLQLLWTKTSWGVETSVPVEFVDEAIEFSMELGTCYMKCKRHQESLSCYLQLWQAIRSCCSFHDKRRMVVVEVLANYYREHRRYKLLIELYKELAIEYRRNFGRSHEHTVAILYLLGDSVLEHGHGYPEDYYREIIEVVGTDTPKTSFKAYKMLCQIYYDENNWVELKIVCNVLWELLVAQHAEHNFDADFVEMLYIRYMYVLRHHDQCDHDRLCTIALQHKQVCILKFGSASPIAIRAMIEHASVLMESDTTKPKAISAYEEIITVSKTTKTDILDETTLVTIKKHMTEAYVFAHANGSASPAMIEQAIILLQERHEHLKVTLGCAHQETLVVFTELISMHFKLDNSKHRNTIIQQLRDAVVEIITKEQSSQLLHQAASLIGAIYIACGLRSQGRELVHEIRRQVIAGHTHGSKAALVMDKAVARVCFVFLVSLETQLTGSVSQSYSEVMANWLTELVLFENYERCLASEAKMEVILIRGARLRSFWALHGRQEEMAKLDQQVFDVFYKHYGATVKTSAEMTKIFLVSVLVHIGSSEAHNKQMAMIEVASLAGNKKIAELLKAGKYQEAHEVGHCTFHFVMSQGGYHKVGLIGLGFTLAGYIAGRSVNREAIPSELRGKMLQTSREIMAEVLHACKDLRINFQRLHEHELNDLVELLGEQENYKELENILESLWNSRHGQKNWSEDTLIKLGARLVQSRHLAAKTEAAIHLAEDISYNLHRVLGGLHPHALAMSTLLSQLYTSAGHHSSAIAVHEQILQLIVSGDDGDERIMDTVDGASTARKHIDLLKAAYQRNEGWVRPANTYKTLIAEVVSMPHFKNAIAFDKMQPVKDWAPKQDDATARLGGMFVKPKLWRFIAERDVRPFESVDSVDSGSDTEVDDADSVSELRDLSSGKGKMERESGWSLRRISNNWGMSVAGPKEERHVSRTQVAV